MNDGVPEQKVHEMLISRGYAAGALRTTTTTAWVNLDARRHILVPDACDGYYPSWMVDEIALSARRVGEDAIADELLKGHAPGQDNIVPKPARARGRANK